jgi:hypothetical protein
MADNSPRPKGRDGALSTLGVAIDGLNLAKELSGITPAKAVFGSVAILLIMIRVSSFLLYEGMLQAHTARTQCLTRWITSSSGYPVLTSVEPLKGE